MYQAITPCLGILALLTAVGCTGSKSPVTYKVTGTVTQAGKAVEVAMVNFLPAEGQKVAVGSTNAKGEFQLSTFGPADGAQPGAYQVTITKIATPPTGSAPPLAPGVLADGDITDSYEPPKPRDGLKADKNANQNLLPVKYASESTSGLVATVNENNKNDFKFEL